MHVFTLITPFRTDSLSDCLNAIPVKACFLAIVTLNQLHRGNKVLWLFQCSTYCRPLESHGGLFNVLLMVFFRSVKIRSFFYCHILSSGSMRLYSGFRKLPLFVRVRKESRSILSASPSGISRSMHSEKHVQKLLVGNF